jgi:hypothetical protein
MLVLTRGPGMSWLSNKPLIREKTWGETSLGSFGGILERRERSEVIAEHIRAAVGSKNKAQLGAPVWQCKTKRSREGIRKNGKGWA